MSIKLRGTGLIENKLKWVIGTHCHWKNQNPRGRFGATVKSWFKKVHFFFLKSRLVWFKKDLCSESKNWTPQKNALCRWICNLRSFLNREFTFVGEEIKPNWYSNYLEPCSQGWVQLWTRVNDGVNEAVPGHILLLSLSCLNSRRELSQDLQN